MKPICHVTVSTGHERESLRSEVADWVLDALEPVLERAIRGGQVAIPNPGGGPPLGNLSATATGDALLVTLYAVDGAPLVTFGVARGPIREGELWKALHAAVRGVPAVTPADQPPPWPWCAVRLELGIAAHPKSVEWLGDLERCCAWTWVERGGDWWRTVAD